jgi:hypothetical protein
MLRKYEKNLHAELNAFNSHRNLSLLRAERRKIFRPKSVCFHAGGRMKSDILKGPNVRIHNCDVSYREKM